MESLAPREWLLLALAVLTVLGLLWLPAARARVTELLARARGTPSADDEDPDEGAWGGAWSPFELVVLGFLGVLGFAIVSRLAG